MAINLSTYIKPIDFARKTLNATAGNIDILTLPTNCKCIDIYAVGSGSVKVCSAGTDGTAIGADYRTIPAGGSLKFNNVQLSGVGLRVAGTVDSDPVEFILETYLGA